MLPILPTEIVRHIMGFARPTYPYMEQLNELISITKILNDYEKTNLSFLEFLQKSYSFYQPP